MTLITAAQSNYTDTTIAKATAKVTPDQVGPTKPVASDKFTSGHHRTEMKMLAFAASAAVVTVATVKFAPSLAGKIASAASRAMKPVGLLAAVGTVAMLSSCSSSRELTYHSYQGP